MAGEQNLQASKKCVNQIKAPRGQGAWQGLVLGST